MARMKQRVPSSTGRQRTGGATYSPHPKKRKQSYSPSFSPTPKAKPKSGAPAYSRAPMSKPARSAAPSRSPKPRAANAMKRFLAGPVGTIKDKRFR